MTTETNLTLALVVVINTLSIEMLFFVSEFSFTKEKGLVTFVNLFIILNFILIRGGICSVFYIF